VVAAWVGMINGRMGDGGMIGRRSRRDNAAAAGFRHRLYTQKRGPSRAIGDNAIGLAQDIMRAIHTCGTIWRLTEWRRGAEWSAEYCGPYAGLYTSLTGQASRAGSPCHGEAL